MTTPKGITERPLDAGNVPTVGFDTSNMSLAKRIAAVWTFIERELRPSYLALWKKVVGMLNSPPEMANPFFDGTTWHSIRLGVKAPDLLDADETLTVAMGDVHIQRKSSLTAPRVKTLSTVGAIDGNVKVLYNFSGFTVTFGSALVASGYYCRYRFDGANWVTPEVLKIVADPEI